MLGGKKAGVVAGATTLVSSDTIVVGDIQFAGNLDVEGVVRGNVIAAPGKDALVRVVGKGRVEGEIRAPLVVVNGQVKGDVYSTERLELAELARVEGNVFYALLEMAVGAEVNGNLSHVDPPQKAPRTRKLGETADAPDGGALPGASHQT